MCRWLVYVGQPIVPGILLYQHDNALILQSEHETYTPHLTVDANWRKRNHEINVHGSGLGWYPLRLMHEQAVVVVDRSTLKPDFAGLEIGDRPCVYTGAQAPSNDRNLRRISESVQTCLMFAHIRAAAPFAPVHEYNCHPFRAGRFMFMHNGGIANFVAVRRHLEAQLSARAYSRITGQTDSELAFALFTDRLPRGDVSAIHPPEAVADALFSTLAVIERVTGSLTRVDPTDEPLDECKSSLNFAVTDGECVCVCRFRSGSTDDPPSLYYTAMTTKAAKAAADSVFVASEPLDRFSVGKPNWNLVEANSMLIISNSNNNKRPWKQETLEHLNTRINISKFKISRQSLRSASASSDSGLKSNL